MTQKKFLTAVDGSDHSYKVIEKAIELSKIYKAAIILIYCHKKFPTILGEQYKEQAVSSTLLEAEDIVKPYISRLAESGVQHSKRLMEEPAGPQIANVAEIEKCDMIIMGSRGLTNLEGLIIGSTTHRVLHMASCSVLVVK